MPDAPSAAVELLAKEIVEIASAPDLHKLTASERASVYADARALLARLAPLVIAEAVAGLPECGCGYSDQVKAGTFGNDKPIEKAVLLSALTRPRGGTT